MFGSWWLACGETGRVFWAGAFDVRWGVVGALVAGKMGLTVVDRMWVWIAEALVCKGTMEL